MKHFKYSKTKNTQILIRGKIKNKHVQNLSIRTRNFWDASRPFGTFQKGKLTKGSKHFLTARPIVKKIRDGWGGMWAWPRKVTAHTDRPLRILKNNFFNFRRGTHTIHQIKYHLSQTDEFLYNTITHSTLYRFLSNPLKNLNFVARFRN